MMAAMVLVHIPLALEQYTQAKGKIEVKAETLHGMIEGLEHKFPGIKDRLRDEKGEVRPYVNIFVNGVNCRDKIRTKLKPNDVIHIIRSIAGGAPNYEA